MKMMTLILTVLLSSIIGATAYAQETGGREACIAIVKYFCECSLNPAFYENEQRYGVWQATFMSNGEIKYKYLKGFKDSDKSKCESMAREYPLCTY